jgi:hypothetical protein
LLELYTTIKGRSFLDLGCGDGCEPRAAAHKGARISTGVEGKSFQMKTASDAQNYLKLPNHNLLTADVRKIDEFDLPVYDVVTCYGLLYHMKNPFNVIKRIRKVTGKLLVLETHVAPFSGFRDRLIPKHSLLPDRMSVVELDGVPFEGIVVNHKADQSQTKSSLNSPWTLWLTVESLIKALLRTDFEIIEYVHEIDNHCPQSIKKWGSVLGFGHANTKVWIVARPKKAITETRVCMPSEKIVSTQRMPFSSQVQNQIRALKSKLSRLRKI